MQRCRLPASVFWNAADRGRSSVPVVPGRSRSVWRALLHAVPPRPLRVRPFVIRGIPQPFFDYFLNSLKVGFQSDAPPLRVCGDTTSTLHKRFRGYMGRRLHIDVCPQRTAISDLSAHPDFVVPADDRILADVHVSADCGIIVHYNPTIQETAFRDMHSVANPGIPAPNNGDPPSYENVRAQMDASANDTVIPQENTYPRCGLYMPPAPLGPSLYHFLGCAYWHEQFHGIAIYHWA